VGATILLTGASLMSRDFWRFFREERATSLAGVPYSYQVLSRIGFLNWELPSLKILTQAGGRLGSELHETFGRYAEKNHVRFYVMYGQAEATSRMSYLPPDRSLEKNDSIGIAIPGGSFHLEDEEGCVVLESGQPGELVYTGKNVTMGYAETREDLAKGDERDGVLHTQDIAVRDSDGYYRIVGRTKRFLKLFGRRYNLDELESLLIRKTGHQDCRCTGSDDNLCIYLTDGFLKAEVETYLKGQLDLSRSVFCCRVIAEIPLKANQKTDYQKLDEGNENDR
jgi:acyl-coenzyme A synthetase/AMP-(fatty) acid ligase